MRLFFWTVLSCIELLRYYSLLIFFEKVKLRRIYLAGIVITLFVLCIYFFEPGVAEARMARFLTTYLILFLTIKMNRQNIVNLLMLTFAQASLSRMCHYLLFFLRPAISRQQDERLFLELLDGTSTFILLILMMFVVSQYRKKERNSKLQPWGIFTLSILLITIVISLFLGGLGHMNYKKLMIHNPFFTHSLGFLAYLAITIIIFTAYYMKKVNLSLHHFVQTEEKLRQKQKFFYESMQQKENATKRYRHDLVNKLVELKYYAEHQTSEEVITYIESMQNEIASIQKSMIATGNDILDIIMNCYLEKMGSLVHKNVHGRITSELDICEYDLANILCDLMQRILDDTKKKHNQENYVQMILSQGSHNAKTTLMNTTKRKAVTDQLIQSLASKEHRDWYDAKFAEIEEIINQNKGTLTISHEQKDLYISVILPLKIPE